MLLLVDATVKHYYCVPLLLLLACSDKPVHRQTKNVAGRLLVGLRYWNEVTDEGSNWRFETLEAARPRLLSAPLCAVHF